MHRNMVFLILIIYMQYYSLKYSYLILIISEQLCLQATIPVWQK